MIVRVIFKDQTAGVVEKTLLEDLIKRGRVAAYNCEDRWIPIETTGCGTDIGKRERIEDLKTKNRRMRFH